LKVLCDDENVSSCTAIAVSTTTITTSTSSTTSTTTSTSTTTTTVPPEIKWPHVTIVSSPSSVNVGDTFSVILKYAHDMNDKGGISINWPNSMADFVSASGGTKIYQGLFNNSELVEWNVSNNDQINITLKALQSGTLNFNYRAWDWTPDNHACSITNSGTGYDYHRDPNTCEVCWGDPGAVACSHISQSISIQHRNFSSTSFKNQTISGGQNVSLNYLNTYSENVSVVFLLINSSGIVSSYSKKLTTLPSGTIYSELLCSNFPAGKYYIAWVAYLESDKELTNPIAWSIVNQRIEIICTG